MQIEWLPFDLHPEIPPEGMTLPPHVRNSFGGMSERLREMAQASGREMVIPEKIPSSRNHNKYRSSGAGGVRRLRKIRT